MRTEGIEFEASVFVGSNGERCSIGKIIGNNGGPKVAFTLHNL
jgi:hypothetical protein